MYSDIIKNKFLNNKKGCVLFRTFFALSISVLFMMTVYFTCGIWFETNDDVFISELLAGKTTGHPEYLLTFVSVIITYPLSRLYVLLPNVPWWGIFIFSVLVLSFSVLFYVLLDISKSWRDIFPGVFILGGFCTGCVHIAGEAEFTSASIMLALAGYVIVCVYGMHGKPLLAFVVCEFFSAAIRDTSMMLIQPVGMCAFLGWEIIRNNKTERPNYKYIFKHCAVGAFSVLTILGVLLFVRLLAFSGQDAARQEREAEIFVYLHDYSLNIDYKEVEDILTPEGINEQDFLQWINYRDKLFDKPISEESLDLLVIRLKELAKAAPKRNLAIASGQLLFTSSQFWHVHKLTLFFFVGAMVLCLLLHEYKAIGSLVIVFGGYIVGIVILAYRDRYVLRIMMPYYFGTIALIIFFMFTLILRKNDKNRISKSAIAIFVFAFSFALLSVGKKQFSYVKRQNEVVNTGYFITMMEINEYCVKNPQKSFLLDLDYAGIVSSDIFESDYYQDSNSFYTGGWYNKNPQIASYGRKYLDDKEIYYIVHESQSWRGVDGLNYYSELLGCEPILEDKVCLSTGATIWVYRLTKEE